MAKTKKFIKKALGNKCSICGSIENLTIHHRKRNKYVLNRASIKQNLHQLDLLCQRCHQHLHFLDDITYRYFEKMKKIKKIKSDHLALWKGLEEKKEEKLKNISNHYLNIFNAMTYKYVKEITEKPMQGEFKHYLKDENKIFRNVLSKTEVMNLRW